MSLNNTSQQGEAAVPMPSLPPTSVATPAAEQSVQLEGVHLEEPPAAAAAPQADSLSSPSPAPELIQPPPPPHEPHPSGLPGPEPKVPAVSPATRTGPGPQPAVLTACLLTHAFHLLSAWHAHTVWFTEPTVCLWLPEKMCDRLVHMHHSGLGDQKDWYIWVFDQGEDIHNQP